MKGVIHEQPQRDVRTIRLTVAGLAVVAAGILIQYATLPEDFPTIPPGPIILGAAALVVALLSRWWAPIVGVLR